ncbi:uncharacterized protein LOC120325369 [Styela clava]
MAGKEKQHQIAKINDQLFGMNFQNKSLNPGTPAPVNSKDGSACNVSSQLNLNDTNDIKVKRLALLRAQAYTLLSQFKFAEAAKPLEEIVSMKITAGLDTSLLFVECYLQLGRENKANKAIEDVRNILLTPPCPDVSDVLCLADELTEISCFIRALVLLRIAGTMFITNSQSGNDALDGVNKCINKTHNIVGGMIAAGDRLLAIAIDYGIEYMNEMLESLRSLQNVYSEKKALLIAFCVNKIGFNYGLAKDNGKSVRVRKGGAEEFERHFGSNATKYRVYGMLLHNIGIGNNNMGKFVEAQTHYLKAIDAKKMALDYDTEKEKTDDVELSEKSLADTLQRFS